MPLMPPNDNVSLSGEMVFGGYGYMNSEEKYNDFAGISVNDRIVIIMTRSPELAEQVYRRLHQASMK